MLSLHTRFTRRLPARPVGWPPRMKLLFWVLVRARCATGVGPDVLRLVTPGQPEDFPLDLRSACPISKWNRWRIRVITGPSTIAATVRKTIPEKSA